MGTGKERMARQVVSPGMSCSVGGAWCRHDKKIRLLISLRPAPGTVASMSAPRDLKPVASTMAWMSASLPLLWRGTKLWQAGNKAE